VAIGLYVGRPGIGGPPTQTASPSSLASSPSPSPVPSPTENSLSPDCVDLYNSGGTYHGNIGTLVVSATVPAGWTGTGHGFALTNAPCVFGGSSYLRISLVGRVYGDACDLLGTDVLVGTPAAAIAVLAEQKGHRTTGPTEVTLGGYQAARFEFSVPADFDPTQCAEGNGTGSMALWQSPGDQHLGQSLGTGVTTVYLVDVDGLAVGVVAIKPDSGPGPAAPAELDAIVESLRFEP
jgi:hypothetical protein